MGMLSRRGKAAVCAAAVCAAAAFLLGKLQPCQLVCAPPPGTASSFCTRSCDQLSHTTTGIMCCCLLVRCSYFHEGKVAYLEQLVQANSSLVGGKGACGEGRGSCAACDAGAQARCGVQTANLCLTGACHFASKRRFLVLRCSRCPHHVRATPQALGPLEMLVGGMECGSEDVAHLLDRLQAPLLQWLLSPSQASLSSCVALHTL